MSIKPIYSSRIFSGEKEYELRRAPARVESGDLVIVYASSPVCAVVGAFCVNGVTQGTIRGLWRRHRKGFGISFAEYAAYFEGADAAYAIQIGPRIEVDPVALDELRNRYVGFRPPQSYMYWREDPARMLGDEVVATLTR
jgi:predicted transcriptional regulator